MLALPVFLAACLCASLAEYGLHRLCHEVCLPLLSWRHWRHHLHPHDNEWWLTDALTFYLPLFSPFYLPTFLLCSWPVALAWCAGWCGYTLVFAWCHAQQHTPAPRASWLHRGIHVRHHHHARGRGNYGVVTPLWDWLLGTLR